MGIEDTNIGRGQNGYVYVSVVIPHQTGYLPLTATYSIG